jgi:hypothetical protein
MRSLEPAAVWLAHMTEPWRPNHAKALTPPV